jgi:hypothetical protein
MSHFAMAKRQQFLFVTLHSLSRYDFVAIMVSALAAAVCSV